MREFARRSRNEKPLYRLWEALCLGALLRPAHGPHIVTRYVSTSLVATRRRFRGNLAFVFDYMKGGASTTSVVIEDSDECFRFWISANQGVTDATLNFASELLKILAESINSDKALAATFEAKITQKCIKFAKNRVSNARDRLRNFSRQCRSLLESEEFSSHEMSRNPKDVASWLQRFDFSRGTSSYDICLLAYNSRHDDEIGVLEQLGRDPGDGTNVSDMAKKFRAVKHFIGRLAAYVRVSKELLEDADRMKESHVLDRYEVAAIEKATPAQVPPVDSQTNLEGILRRMLPRDDPQFPLMLGTLQTLDVSVNLEEKIRKKFDGGIGPCVHAEIQMLEHCVRTGLKFAWGDRYIACSKPACLACRAYFENHPGRFVRPDSHQKLYVNWAPALQADDSGNMIFSPDLELFNKVIKDIREVALQQIDEARVSSEVHADSLTMITEEEERYDTSSFEDEDSEESEDEDEDEGVSLVFDDMSD